MSTDKQSEASPAQRVRDYGMLAVVLSLSLLVTGACASTPKYRYVEHSRTFDRGYDEVWEDLMRWFTSGELQIKTLERASGVVYAERTGVPASWPADCGKPSIFTNVVSRGMTLNVFVRNAGESLTEVTVNMSVTETRSLDTRTWNVECFSTGQLETSLLDALEP